MTLTDIISFFWNVVRLGLRQKIEYVLEQAQV